VREETTIFQQRYGPWAVVAGASEGLGAAFADDLAARGLHLVLIARRSDVLDALADRLRTRHGIDVITVAMDLADGGFAEFLAAQAQQHEIGVAVYNAAYSFVGPLLASPLDDALRVTDVNVRGPLRFVHALAPAMVERRRGAIIIMSSLAGFTGSPGLATYAASKSFLTTLAEGLWAELRPHGIDVLASCAGAISTPNYRALRRDKKDAPGTLRAEAVVAKTLAAIGNGPTVVPGSVNRAASVFLRRVAPRKLAIKIMGTSIEAGA
jgi:uncharacterized protein